MTTIGDRVTGVLVGAFMIERRDVGPDTTLAELGFDSVLVAELSLAIDNEFGTALADGEISAAMTAADVAGVVALRTEAA